MVEDSGTVEPRRNVKKARTAVTSSITGADLLTSVLKKEYQLCKSCIQRQAGQVKNPDVRFPLVEKCHICKGLFDRIGEITEKALEIAAKYQYDTFLVGATLPTQLYEREDALRARFKIRGKESIKNQLTRELGIYLSTLTQKKVDYQRPDLTINIVIDRDGGIEASARSKPLALECRYVKRQRGLSQKSDKCPLCLGKGCNLCEGTGLGNLESIEGILTQQIMKITGGVAPKFSWIGSEDQSSLVLGDGRPFYVKVSDPKVRKLDVAKFNHRESGIETRIVQILDDVPAKQTKFVVRTKVTCRCDRPITLDDLKRLEGSLVGSQPKFESKGKLSTKKIYSAAIVVLPGLDKKKNEGREQDSDNDSYSDSASFVLDIVADGGLPIKQFVGGEQYIEPNISSILDCKCQCITFDIFDVSFQ